MRKMETMPIQDLLTKIRGAILDNKLTDLKNFLIIFFKKREGKGTPSDVTSDFEFFKKLPGHQEKSLKKWDALRLFEIFQKAWASQEDELNKLIYKFAASVGDLETVKSLYYENDFQPAHRDALAEAQKPEITTHNSEIITFLFTIGTDASIADADDKLDELDSKIRALSEEQKNIRKNFLDSHHKRKWLLTHLKAQREREKKALPGFSRMIFNDVNHAARDKILKLKLAAIIGENKLQLNEIIGRQSGSLQEIVKKDNLLSLIKLAAIHEHNDFVVDFTSSLLVHLQNESEKQKLRDDIFAAIDETVKDIKELEYKWSLMIKDKIGRQIEMERENTSCKKTSLPLPQARETISSGSAFFADSKGLPNGQLGKQKERAEKEVCGCLCVIQ